jgi:hypothetical protein
MSVKKRGTLSRSLRTEPWSKQNVREEAGEPKPEPKDRTMTVSALTGWCGVSGAGVEVSEHRDWNEQRAAATGQGTVGCLLAVTRFWKRRRGLRLTRLQCLICRSHLHKLARRHLCCCSTLEMIIQVSRLQVETSPSSVSFVLHFIIFLELEPSYPFLSLCLWTNLSLLTLSGIMCIMLRNTEGTATKLQ